MGTGDLISCPERAYLVSPDTSISPKKPEFGSLYKIPQTLNVGNKSKLLKNPIQGKLKKLAGQFVILSLNATCSIRYIRVLQVAIST